MLDITKIHHCAVHAEDWHKARLGKITASEISKIMSDKSHEGVFTKGAITYFEELAHETITGEQYRDEIFTRDIEWGNAHEVEAIQYFLKETGLHVLRDENGWNTHRLIIHDEVFGATPDALIPVNKDKLFNDEGTAINIRTLEVKCPRKKFPKFYKCKTPLDLLKAEPVYFYQKMAQMEFCGDALGYWAAYHPMYPNKMRIIEFKKSELQAEFKKFNATCYYAKQELLKTIELLKN